MAEKHRFRKNREFKKRIDEEEENNEQDIRSFKFLSLERRREAERKDNERKRFYRDDKEGRGDRRFDREDKKYDRSERGDRKPYGKRDGGRGGKPFGGKGGKRDGKYKSNYRDNEED